MIIAYYSSLLVSSLLKQYVGVFFSGLIYSLFFLFFFRRSLPYGLEWILPKSFVKVTQPLTTIGLDVRQWYDFFSFLLFLLFLILFFSSGDYNQVFWPAASLLLKGLLLLGTGVIAWRTRLLIAYYSEVIFELIFPAKKQKNKLTWKFHSRNTSASLFITWLSLSSSLFHSSYWYSFFFIIIFRILISHLSFVVSTSPYLWFGRSPSSPRASSPSVSSLVVYFITSSSLTRSRTLLPPITPLPTRLDQVEKPATVVSCAKEVDCNVIAMFIKINMIKHFW